MNRHLLRAEDTEFVGLLRACSRAKDLRAGVRLHAELLKEGIPEISFLVQDALVQMYVKCGAVLKAYELLVGLRVKNTTSWNNVIAAFIGCGQCPEALDCFDQLKRQGVPANSVTFSCALKACARIRAVSKGEQIHDEIAIQGLLGCSIILGAALVDMYAKCGSLIMAEQVLKSLPNRNVITWTALVSGFALHGHGHDALRCFELMLHEGLSPDAVTFVGVLKACGNIKAAAKGERFHDEIIRKGLLRGNNVLLAALIDMYVKCGCLMKAWDILEENPDSDVFCWTSLIEGYVEQGLSEEALECFKLMKQKGVSPTTVTFASVLKACGSIGAVESGEQIHEEISRQGLLLDDFVLGSALVDMYVKCGALLKAKKARDQLPVHDLVSWTTLIAGYAQQGQNQEALNCFKQMEHFDVSPNEVTFTCILNACSHSGLVEEGEMYFTLMYTNYGIKPVLEHYACMVDLYGRAGLFNLAISFVSKIPFDDYMAVWRSVLKACEKRKDVTIGRWAFEHALQIHNGDAALYDLMSNIYRSAGMQENMESIEAVRAESKSWEKMVSF